MLPVAAEPVAPSFTPFVSERFHLNVITQAALKARPEPWDRGYGPFSEFIFYRTYSRDGEAWWQVIQRVIEGAFSIRKDHYVKNQIPWDEEVMQRLAHEMAISAFDGEWGPPGRGYWAMGTDLIYTKGSMALNNCGFVDIKDLGRDAHWAMDGLMMGVGVGFSTYNDVLSGLRYPGRGYRSVYDNPLKMARIENPEDDRLHGTPYSTSYYDAKSIWNDPEVGIIEYVIPDSREGWCDSTKLLIDSYYGTVDGKSAPLIKFDYSRIRPRGAKIKGFGGEASGPWPLRKLHRQLRVILDMAVAGKMGNSQLITDVINLMGCCIVAGNVRRSATIALGHPDDAEFAELKNYDNPRYRYRRRHGWMSNNSYVLSERTHFAKTLPMIADGIKRNGEPGFYNLKAVRAFGRLGDRVGTKLASGELLREDLAVGINPCGEVPLESYELCCLAEWYPTRCIINGRLSQAKALKAASYAAFYTQTVQLLGTHRPETNEVIARNRRTGVSLAGAAALRELTSTAEMIALMEEGYDVIRKTNAAWSKEAGVPEAIRVTAEKPSGTTSLMMGVPAGCHWPTSGYIRRAARVDNGREKLREVLDEAQIPHEPDLFSANTEVYYFPVRTPGAESIRPVHEVSMWEQADMAALLAQHFVDNAVSVTVTFDPLTRQEQKEQLDGLNWKIRNLQSVVVASDTARRGTSFLRWKKRRKYAEISAQASIRLEEARIEQAALQLRRPEGDDVERLVSSYIGKLKSMSMLPRSGHGYVQAPETAITKEEYEEEYAALGSFDWSRFRDQGVEEVYCASCEVV